MGSLFFPKEDKNVSSEWMSSEWCAGGQERVFGVDVFGVVRSENTNESGEHDSSQAEPLRARSSQGRRL